MRRSADGRCRSRRAGGLRLAQLALIAALAATTWTAHALDVDGVTVAERIRLAPDGAELVLNGAGVRTRTIFRVYVAGLYLQARQSSLKSILADKGPKRIGLTMLRDVSARQFIDALLEGIRENHTASELEALKNPVDELVVVMTQMGAAKKDATINLDYLPGAGTQVSMNGVARGKPIPGEDLYRALLQIWLGEDPVDRSLRRALLGQ